MIRLLEYILKHLKRYRCRRAYNRLPSIQQELVKFTGSDPDTLIKKGKL